MVKLNKKIRFLPEMIFLILLLCSANLLFAVEENSEEWQIVVSDSLLQDEAVKVAINDLQNTGSSLGIDFKIAREGSIPNTPAILVGDASKNKVTARIIKKGLVHLSGIDDEQGYEIRTVNIKKNRVIVVAGGSVIGDVYGLYWVRDRLLINHEIPDINIVKIPELKIRSTIMELTKENIRKALQSGINWIGGGRLNDLVPWGVDPEDSRSKRNREQFKELIDYAHALHLTIFIYTDEFTYHPNLLKEFGAGLSPEDPFFWDAFQAKFRRILKALPEIDGIMFRTGEFTLAGESKIKAYDLMHGEEDDSDWSLEKRYQTFIQKAHEVMVGEFDKIYFHRTWVTNSYEQHSKGQVYKKIFTDEVPLKNLYLSPYINAHDRWFFTAYNPTFNITPHNMIALLARMDYHTNSNVHIFPTFSGQYFQAALKGIQYHPNYQNIKAKINSKENMIELENSLLLMRNLIQTNNMYVKCFIEYFDYRADPIQEHKTKLTDLIDGLKSSIEEFQNTPGYVYHLFGINQLIINAEQALSDLENAETILANAPKPSDIRKTIVEQQQKYIYLMSRVEAIGLSLIFITFLKAQKNWSWKFHGISN